MSKYKAGDKVVLDVLSIDDNRWYKIGGEYYSWWENINYLDKVSEPLTEYTEKLEKKNENKQKRIEKLVERLHRQAAEITRLLKENEELKANYEALSDALEGFRKRVDDMCEVAAEQARAEGQEEAWKLATNIALDEMFGGYKVYELKEIFGSMHLADILHQTYTEAAAKVAEWERKTEEICVGDIVRFRENHNAEFCVTEIYDDRLLYGIDAEGGVYADRDIKLFEKTGRHIDIKSMLAQIGGEE